MIGPNMLVAFNHEYKLVPFEQDSEWIRYLSAVYYLNVEYERSMNEERFWTFLNDERGRPPYSVTVHSSIFVPDHLWLGTAFWVDEYDNPLEDNHWYGFDTLFEYPEPDEPPGDDDDDDTDENDHDLGLDRDPDGEEPEDAPDDGDGDRDDGGRCGC
ncbi:MAG: hypothetical protein M5R36_19000 [Deltaproteobacteria bacterium]|nr:hypothetical protein [Deltaproteobacteria bacterium]